MYCIWLYPTEMCSPCELCVYVCVGACVCGGGVGGVSSFIFSPMVCRPLGLPSSVDRPTL